jgi:hypothetical protein
VLFDTKRYADGASLVATVLGRRAVAGNPAGSTNRFEGELRSFGAASTLTVTGGYTSSRRALLIARFRLPHR